MKILTISLILTAYIVLVCNWFASAEKLLRYKFPRNKLEKINDDGISKYTAQCSQILYIEQNIDHFNFDVNTKTYKMRYIRYDKFWSKGNPILFYTGNEDDIVWFCENSGFMWHLAEDLKALVVFAEHRYYGESNPFGNQSFSTPAINFLTIEQALADYSYLIKDLQTVYGEVPLIAIGGSYGGMLASWMRMKYPYLITGAYASSAPIFQYAIKCDAFFRAITDSFKKADSKCTPIIRSSWDAINELAKTETGLKQLTATFRLCQPLKVSSEKEILKKWLNDMYLFIAMSDFPYATNFFNPLPAWPVKEICSKIASAYKPNPINPKDPIKIIEAIYQGANVFMNFSGNTNCIRIDQYVSSPMNYQTCSELVYPMCSTGVNDMFEPKQWNYNAYSQNCYNTWNVRPRSQWAFNYYGASVKDLKSYSNIIFTNGDLDPWAPGGVLVPVNDKIQTIIIEKGAHHLELREPNPADPQSVLIARQKIKETIMKWIKEFKDEESSSVNKTPSKQWITLSMVFLMGINYFFKY